MDTEILRVVGEVAGIGGLALGVFVLLFREVIRKSIFSSLTRENSYRLMRLITVLVWSVTVIGIITYACLSYWARPQTTLRYGGSVKDSVRKLPIEEAVVSIVGRPDIAAQKTDKNGNFSLTLETAAGNFQGTVQVAHYGYETWSRVLRLTSGTTDDIHLVEERPQDFELSGAVLDEKGAIEDVRISVKDATTRSGKEGAFKLTVKGRHGERFELNADKEGYQHWQEAGVEPRAGIGIVLERK